MLNVTRWQNRLASVLVSLTIILSVSCTAANFDDSEIKEIATSSPTSRPATVSPSTDEINLGEVTPEITLTSGAISAVVTITAELDQNDELPKLTSTAEVASLTPAPPPKIDASVLKFIREYVDLDYGGNGRPGWVRAGDMDKDGDVDIVAGGGRALFIYENDGGAAGWQRYGTLDSTGEMGANGGVLSDVDNDGDLDVVSAKFEDDLGWWENPGGKLSNTPWSFHILSDENKYLHDIIVADLDKDGVANEFIANLNAGYWNAKIDIKWFKIGANPRQLWSSYTIEEGRNEGSPHGHAGLDVGDIDNDGNNDLAFANGWYEAPDDPTGSWTWRQTTDVYGISNALIRDIDNDMDMDLVVTAGHHGQGVYWLENDGTPLSGPWTRNNISAVVGDVTKRHFYQANEAEHLHHPECLAVVDLEGDGDQDIITCDLFFGEDSGEPDWNEEAHNIYIFENLGDGSSWTKHNIAPNSYPSHLLQMIDVNKDGLLDIISEGAGYSIVSYYEAQNSADMTNPAPR